MYRKDIRRKLVLFSLAATLFCMAVMVTVLVLLGPPAPPPEVAKAGEAAKNVFESIDFGNGAKPK